tara:strand:+ start:1115 stop:1612 length:498 start_codon:yes stop_codon:yes gene_type:complete
MERLTPDKAILKLWNGFGRNPQTKRDQFDLHMNWTKDKSSKAIEETVDFILNNEDTFPTISKLNTVYKTFEKSTPIDYKTDKCFFCDGTGVLPYLYSPDGVHNTYHTRYSACRCSAGVSLKLPSFFETKQPQFDMYPKGMNYTQFVEMKKTELNRSLHEKKQTDQ